MGKTEGPIRVRVIAAKPLRKWLSGRLQDEGIWDPASCAPIPNHHAPRSLDMIAKDWGTSAKRLQLILRGEVETVTESYADRLLTGAGSPHLLRLIYDLSYEDDEIAA